MKITPLKTKKVVAGDSLLQILDVAITHLEEGSIVAITSKIVAICQGRLVSIGKNDKAKLVRQESQYYLPPEHSKYGITLTIKDNILIPTAGIDESNSDGHYVLWPEDVQAEANTIYDHLRRRFSLSRLGVIITDSKTTPLRWGTTGVSMAYSGFQALNDYIGKPDIFGEPLKVTKANIADALAVSAVVTMGEGSEQTPLVIIEDAHFVQFSEQHPTPEELAALHIPLTEDLYAPLLTAVEWKKGAQSDTLQQRD